MITFLLADDASVHLTEYYPTLYIPNLNHDLKQTKAG